MLLYHSCICSKASDIKTVPVFIPIWFAPGSRTRSTEVNWFANRHFFLPFQKKNFFSFPPGRVRLTSECVRMPIQFCFTNRHVQVHVHVCATTLAKKIVTAEIFMRLIRSAIMWYHATSTSICNASSRRAVPRVAPMSNRSSISHDRTADQSHEYLGCIDFFGQVSTCTVHTYK